jgi:hypothetical protein
MFDKSAQRFIRNKRQLPGAMKILSIIASRSCTFPEQEQCINRRPERIEEWCSRCIALEYLVNGDK